MTEAFTVPVIVVAAMDAVLRQSFCAGLVLDLGDAVVVQHDLRVGAVGGAVREVGAVGGAVRRVVMDRGGVVYDDEQLLDHACLACAVREDLVPTVAQLAQDGRWRTVVVALPVTADPQTVVSALNRAVETDDLGPARVACVVSLADAETLLPDLFGDDLLVERGSAMGEVDRRSVGEALARQLECADLVGVTGTLDNTVSAVVERLAPAAGAPSAWSDIAGAGLTSRRLTWSAARRRTDPLLVSAGGLPDRDGVWSLALRSSAPFHPERLMDRIEDLGCGRIRSRGHFWLPTRADEIGVWDGAGGQLSVGAYGFWGSRPRSTHLTYVGIDAADRDRIADAFAETVLTPAELRRLDSWTGRADGFEPWLGDRRSAA